MCTSTVIDVLGKIEVKFSTDLKEMLYLGVPEGQASESQSPSHLLVKRGQLNTLPSKLCQ
jgi:hypothetical protein